MKRIKLWLIFLLVGVSFTAYILLRTPECKNLAELPGFFNENHHFFPLKINKFSSRNIPQIEIQIEDRMVPLKVDLGWDGPIVLPKGVIDTLNNKSFIKKVAFFGIRGRSYESDVYELPHIKIGKLKIFSIWAEEENENFVKDSILNIGEQEISEEHIGRIGWRVFKPFNLLLDSDFSTLVLCDSLDILKEQGFPITTFIEAPLFLDRNFIDFEVMTEAGPLRCTLDTGSTWNILNKDFENANVDHRLIDLDHLEGKPLGFNPKNDDLLIFKPEDSWESKTFQMNGTDFGPINFVKLQSPLGLDVIVGMEFIDNHLIFIDFQKEKIYFSKLPIQRSHRSLLTRVYDLVQIKVQEIWKSIHS